MFKSIFNIFLVFIICITASGMPLELNAPDFSFNLPSFENPSKEEEISNKELPNQEEEPIKPDTTYAALPPYIYVVNELPRGMMPLMLYFPDSKNQYLIPVTRYVKYTKAPLRTTIENLTNGSDFGFVSPIPNIEKLRVKNSTAIVYLPSDIEKYNQDPVTGTFALESLVYSLTAVPGIDKIKFLVNGKESDQLFNQYSTQTLFSKNVKPQAYLAFDCGKDRLLLVPQTMDETDEKPLIESMMHALKTSEIDGNPLPNVISPIPENVKLMNFSKNANILNLNFNKEFLSAYENRADLQKLMIDSILYSFSSIQGIEKLQILVENQKINAFAGMDLSLPITKPNFINPEKE